jgi:hypothetical protein
MSITQYLNTTPFSLTGIQNANTVNGNQPVDSITILGQTQYLSSSVVDALGNVNLTLNIPNANTTTTGLLTSTDWNTFTAGSVDILPLDNVFTGGSNTFNSVSITDGAQFNFNNEIEILSNGVYRLYTAGGGSLMTIDANLSITPGSLQELSGNNILYYDASNGAISYENLPPSIDILPLNNTFFGQNTFDNKTFFDDDVSMNAKLFLNSDVSMNGGGNLYIKADGSGLTGNPKLILSLPNFKTEVNDIDDLYRIVQSGNNKAFYLSRLDNQIYSHYPLNTNDSDYFFATGTIPYLDGCFIFSGINLTADRTIFLPIDTQFASIYGTNYSCSFTILTAISALNNFRWKIAKTNPSSINTTMYVNQVQQTTFPFFLSLNTPYIVEVEAFFTGSSQILIYNFRSLEKARVIPNLQQVLNSGNTTVSTNIDLTNGELYANLIYVNTIGSLALTDMFIYSNMVFNPDKVLAVDFSNTDPLIKTTTTDVNYNPEIIYYNDNSNNKTILPPMCKGQKMSLINNGVLPVADWVQLGSPISYPIQLFKQMTDGNIWIAYNTSSTSAEIQIFDSTNNTQLGQINLDGALDGITQIKVMLEDDSLDYVYIGGEFRTINSNAQNQFCITRVVRSTFVEDPLFDSSTTDYGVDGVVNTLLQAGSDLLVGGEYHFIEPTLTTAECFIKVSNCNATSGTQTYSQMGGGVSTAISKFSGYLDISSNPILVMVGSIDNVDIANTPIATSNIACYDISNNIWTATSGTVSFNDTIFDIIPNTFPTTHFIVVGLFTDYIRAVSVDLSTETSISGITVSSPFYNNSIIFQNPSNCFAVDYWYEIDTINFTGVQKAYTSITPTTQIMCADFLNGNFALSWFNQSEIYEYLPNTPSQDCIFSIDQTNPNSYFIYGNVDTYIDYLLTGKFQATYFTANEYNSILYWTPLGQPQGSFS